MCKVIAIGNQKGGVSKTTSTSNLGIGLARKGQRVLVIDSDAQGSLTASLGYTEPDELEVTLVPVQAAYLPVKGLQELIKTIGKVKRQLNPNLTIEGILLTMVDSRTNYAREIIEMLRDAYGNSVKIFDHSIPFSVRAAEISAEGVSIFKHDPKGKVAQAYMELTEEVLNNGR